MVTKIAGLKLVRFGPVVCMTAHCMVTELVAGIPAGFPHLAIAALAGTPC